MSEQGIVAVRPMVPSDVRALARWGRHDDPLYQHYNVPVLTGSDAEELWTFLSGEPALRRPFAGLLDGEVVASLIIRNMHPPSGSGELGIILDPARIGQGLGRRILAAFATVLAGEGFRRLHLEVAGYNERAIGAYRAAGFAVIDEYWSEPEAGMDLDALLDGPAAGAVAPNVRRASGGRYEMRTVRMERRLAP